MGANRTLIYVPVLHSPADMGSFASVLTQAADYAATVGMYWQRVDEEFRAMRRGWAGVLIYQDGLPDARPDIVARILADVDSPNYRLLRWLAGQGASVIGTEDPVLLQEEYELLKASIADDSARRVYAARAAGLLAERDRYIVTRIDATLPDDGTGVLFTGMQHRAAEALPPDFTVTTLRSCREMLPRLTDLRDRRAAGAGGEG